MEYSELKILWEKYDHEIDNRIKLDKDLIAETLIKQHQSRLNTLIKENIFHLISFIWTIAIIISTVLHNTVNIDWKLMVGIIIMSFSLLDFYFLTKKRNKILKEINLKTDTVIESINKLITYPKTRFRNLRHLMILLPLYLIGLALIMWNNIIIDNPDPKYKILSFLVIFGIGFIIGFPFYLREKRKITGLIDEIKLLDNIEE